MNDCKQMLFWPIVAFGLSARAFTLAEAGVGVSFAENNGAIVSLRGADGVERLQPAAEMFTLSFLDADGNETRMKSSDFALTRDGNRLRYARAGGPTVEIAVRLAAGAAYFRPSVRDWPKGLTLNWIDAPQVVAATDGTLFWPFSEGVEVTDFAQRRSAWKGYEPVGWMRKGRFPGGIYPRAVQMQFLAHYRGGKGVYFAANDPHHAQKGVDWESVSKDAVRLTLQTYCGEAKAGVYESPFEYELRPYAGGWTEACARYRDWLRTQPDFREKRTYPAWMKDSPVTLIYPVKGEGMDNTKGMKPNRYYPYVNAMADVDRYARAFDSRLMPLLMHWEGTAPWCPPYVWPPFGGEAKLAEFRDALHAKGHLLGVYCSGTAWTQASSVDAGYACEQQCREQNLTRHMMRGPKGEIAAITCNGLHSQRLGYEMCMTEPWCRRTVIDEVRKIAGFGIDYCQFFDQNLGGASLLCWAKDHAHPPIPGAWQTTASRTLHAEMDEAIRASGSHMIMGCEAAAATPFVKNLFFNDSRIGWTRWFGKPVPALAFVFHEWMCNFSGNQCGVRTDPFFRWTYSFHCGDMLSAVLGPDGKLVTAWATPWTEPLPDQEKLVTLIRTLNGLRKRYPTHLLGGKMVAPWVEVRCDEALVPGYKPALKYAKVLASFWENEKGERVAFLSNWTLEKVEATLVSPDGSRRKVALAPLQTIACPARQPDEYDHVVHPGSADGSGFWNRRAKWFMYAPAFDFKRVEGASAYRFTVIDDLHERHAFEAKEPTSPLTPVWRDLPTGYVTVACEGLDVRGQVLGHAGERTFWKQAGFRAGTYPKAAKSYRAAALAVYDYIFNLSSTRYLLKIGKPDRSYDLNSYISKMFASLIRGMVRYAKLAPERSATAMEIAHKAADYLIAKSEPAGAPLEYFPPTYDGFGEQGNNAGERYRGQIMLIYPAGVARSFLDLAAATGETRYRDAAERIAGTYLKLMSEDGTCPLKMVAKTGEPVGTNRLVPIQCLTPLFEQLFAATGKDIYRQAAERTLKSLEGRLANWNWEGQFEDVQPTAPYENLTKHDACSTAIYFAQHYPNDAKRRSQMRELLRFAEDQFVCWEIPFKNGRMPTARRKRFWSKSYDVWQVPCALEQYNCHWPIDASAAKLIRTYLAAYRLEGHADDLAKARALGDTATRMQCADGRLPTWWWPERARVVRADWINCMMATAEALLQLDEFENVVQKKTSVR